MSYIYILGLAVALAMDAFAVSIAVGIGLKKISFRQGFRLSFHFGLFQALMPVIGWFCGNLIHTFIESYAHWIAFSLLAIVGTNMLREALADDDEEDKKKDPTKGASLIVLSVATSIDALAIGLSISMLQQPITLAATVIGVIASIFTLVGMHLGKKISQLKKTAVYAELFGGIVLWIIGINILIEKYAG